MVLQQRQEDTLTSKQRVRAALAFQNPDRLPILYLNRDKERSDILCVGYEPADVRRRMCACGVEAIAFGDDWGTQANLMVSPEFFRSFFKPHFKRQFALVKSLGCQVYFHNCGL